MRYVDLFQLLICVAALNAMPVQAEPGARSGTIAIDLTLAPGFGDHADASVFSLFEHNAASWQFGTRLMAYLRDTAKHDARIRHLIESSCTKPQAVCVETIDRDVDIAVTFKDGRARYRLNETASHASLISGTAFDVDGHLLSANRADYVGVDFDFPGGVASDTYRRFADLMRARQVPLGPGGWSCVAIDGAKATVRCRLETRR